MALAACNPNLLAAEFEQRAGKHRAGPVCTHLPAETSVQRKRFACLNLCCLTKAAEQRIIAAFDACGTVRLDLARV